MKQSEHERIKVSIESSIYLQIMNKVLVTMCLVVVFFAPQYLCLVENLLIPCKDLLMNMILFFLKKRILVSVLFSVSKSRREKYGCDMIKELMRIRDMLS